MYLNYDSALWSVSHLPTFLLSPWLAGALPSHVDTQQKASNRPGERKRCDKHRFFEACSCEIKKVSFFDTAGDRID
jgi:hypothetical protein